MDTLPSHTRLTALSTSHCGPKPYSSMSASLYHVRLPVLCAPHCAILCTMLAQFCHSRLPQRWHLAALFTPRLMVVHVLYCPILVSSTTTYNRLHPWDVLMPNGFLFNVKYAEFEVNFIPSTSTAIHFYWLTHRNSSVTDGHIEGYW